MCASIASRTLPSSVSGRQVDHGGQAVVGKPAADDGCRPDDREGVGRQRRQPGPEDVSQQRRDGRLGPLARLGEHLDVEGQAARAFEHRVDLDRLRRPPEDPAELLLDFSAVERGQLDALDAADPAKLGEQAHERVPPVQVVGSVGRDDRDPLARHVPDQEPDQVAGRAVRPLEVFDREHHGAVTRDPSEGAEDRVEQPRLTADGIRPIVPCAFDVGRRTKVGHEASEDGGRTVRRRPRARPRPATVRTSEAPRRTGRRAGRLHRDRGSPRGASGHRGARPDRRARRAAGSCRRRRRPQRGRTQAPRASRARRHPRAGRARCDVRRMPGCLSRRVMPPIMRSSRPPGKAGGQPFVGGSGVEVGSSVSARPGRPGIPIRHQTKSRTPTTTTTAMSRSNGWSASRICFQFAPSTVPA